MPIIYHSFSIVNENFFYFKISCNFSLYWGKSENYFHFLAGKTKIQRLYSLTSFAFSIFENLIFILQTVFENIFHFQTVAFL